MGLGCRKRGTVQRSNQKDAKRRRKRKNGAKVTQFCSRNETMPGAVWACGAQDSAPRPVGPELGVLGPCSTQQPAKTGPKRTKTSTHWAQ